MGTFLGLAGERAEGDLVHRQTLSGAKEDFGEQSETYVELLLEVGHALCSRGETERAEQYFSRGLEILDALGERLYLPDDSTLQRMALCYRDAGDDGKAIAAYEDLLDGRVKDKGALDMDDAGELWALAEAHESRGSLDDAARYYMRLAELGEQAGGMYDELLKRTYVKIIEVTTGQGDLEKAEEYRARGERLPGWNGQ
jgi:tetratricopeptide (TPR) repeat protein